MTACFEPLQYACIRGWLFIRMLPYVTEAHIKLQPMSSVCVMDKVQGVDWFMQLQAADRPG
jgi:hypothetical protein